MSKCKVMYGHVSDDLFNREDTCLVVNQNCLSYRNFGRCYDIVEKYPYGDVAGLRKPDKFMKMYAALHERGVGGDCLLKAPPHYKEGPTIATLISEYGIGPPIEENTIAQKIVQSGRNQDLVRHFSRDTKEQRGKYFKQALRKLGRLLTSQNHLKNIIIPLGIGRRGQADHFWLTHYLPLIHRLSVDMDNLGKKVFILISETVLHSLKEEFQNRPEGGDDAVYLHFQSLKDLEVVEKKVLQGKKRKHHETEEEGDAVSEEEEEEVDGGIWDVYPPTQDFLPC